jgi:hypothetical protein
VCVSEGLVLNTPPPPPSYCYLGSFSDHEGGNVSAHTGHLVIIVLFVAIFIFLLMACQKDNNRMSYNVLFFVEDMHFAFILCNVIIKNALEDIIIVKLYQSSRSTS